MSLLTLTTNTRERGATLVTFALVLLFLLAVAGIALDLGRMFIVKSELQTAMDSCALAAAHELDGAADADERALSAGLTAANLNRVNLQSADWDGQGQFTEPGFRLLDSELEQTTEGEVAEYAECTHTQSGIRMWLLHILTSLDPDAEATTSRAVAARAVATRTHAQTACPIPVALLADESVGYPDYGLKKGDLVKILSKKPNEYVAGEMGWFNPTDTNSAKDTKDLLREGALCNTAASTSVELGTRGVKSAVAEQWNARFGLYKGQTGPADISPDLSGYSYAHWIYTPGVYALDDFLERRAANAPNQKTSNGFKAPISSDAHAQYGKNRRLVLVPFLSSGFRIIDYACVLMLEPFDVGLNNPVRVEYQGNANRLDSPCTTSGLAGGSIGPLVPVLVQ